MTAVIIDGKKIAEGIRNEVGIAVKERIAAGLSVPGLATVLVGNDPASQIYVRNKMKACDRLGIYSVSYTLPEDTDFETLKELINQLNVAPEIHGILVQLPLPPQIDEYSVLSMIN
ncbi:MAG TPA: tetrahydrofolate dehydrogenase/cyclohydrolase catalytic domain-containing protein, partial [Flexilinea sp.]|nr:tetrahydrofolate dehydrogenase/cyclohydrolase catalytic domain-containing protein [Flexilinea sp.]